MGMGVIHSQQATSHRDFEKKISAARPTEILNHFFQNLGSSQRCLGDEGPLVLRPEPRARVRHE